MIGCSKIIVTVSEDKKFNVEMKGKLLHPIEVVKLLHSYIGLLLSSFSTEPESKIIKPEIN